MKTPVAPEGDSSMLMTGKLGQHRWFPQPGLQGLLVLLEGMVLGSKEEVVVPDITRAEAGIWDHLLLSIAQSLSFFSLQP